MTIDWWTLAIQAINVLILIWLLARFLWRPLEASIEARRKAAEATLKEAEAMRAEAAAGLAEIDATRARFAEERAAGLAEAKMAAEALRTDILSKAAEEAEAQKALARTALAREAEETRAAWAKAAAQLAVDIARKLLAHLDERALREAFLGSLTRELAQLPEAARRSLGANGAALTAVSATPLDSTEKERCRALLGEAIGHPPHLAFATDPGLIAGLELKGPHVIVANSWRADLETIRAEIGHDRSR
ncbi:F0F1 ATP synthase subunit B family protein [Jiella pacifica]|uniref:ATP synthase subunit b n=1 Tax=Jiella pacifica TaxID=2696469 RepID=A0A6N9TBR8_9HYPH|nr:ATPase [Jiella pacifica]NDW07119.1 ATPase [Jiella pacifica]